VAARFVCGFKSVCCPAAASTEVNDGKQIRDHAGGSATPFNYGSGHVDPVKALDPGLVYDTTPVDYVNFLCSLKLTQDPLPNLPVPVDVPVNLSFSSITLPLLDAAGDPFTCSRGFAFRPEDLNYPSTAVPCLSGSATVKRRVKNVGAKADVYTVKIVQPTGVKVGVLPNKLSFGNVGEEEFTVKLEVYDAAAAAEYVFGSIEWSDGTHRVLSPVVTRTKCT
jgi:hypothetical protein